MRKTSRRTRTHEKLIISEYFLILATHLFFFGEDLPVAERLGDPDGDSVRIGEDSLSSLPTSVFCTETLEENFIRGSLRSSFSSSAGVYWSKNSSIDRNPPPTRTKMVNIIGNYC